MTKIKSNYKEASYSRKGSINNPTTNKLKNVWKDLGTINTLQAKEIITLGKHKLTPNEVDTIARNQKVKKTK